MENINVVAVADLSKRNLHRAGSLGIQNLFKSYHTLFDTSSLNLDAAIIALPNHLHVESAQLALESGLDIFIEKPLANTVEDCKKIMKLERKYSRKIMVGHYFRFLHFIERMKQIVDRGQIGELEVITSEMVTNGPFTNPVIPQPVSEWWFNVEKTGGGALIDIGPHLIDLFRFFNGEAGVEFCNLSHRFNLPVEDGAVLILNSRDSSTRGIINLGWYQKTSFSKFDFRVILHGTAGFLSSDERANPYTHAIKEGTKNILRRLVGKDIQPLSYSETLEAYYKEIKHFLTSIRNDTEPLVSSRDGLKTIEIIESIYSLKRGETGV